MTPRRLPERIEAEDLVIRRWTAGNVDGMTNLIVGSLDHLRPWMAWAKSEPLSTDARLQLFERWDQYWASGDGAVYAVEDSEELVGGCALHRRVGPGGIDLGYWLGHHSTGRSIATRTAAALTGAAFRIDDIDFVQISHTASNQRSRAVAERLAFTNVTPPGEQFVTTWQQHRSAMPVTRLRRWR